jgi:hypothetical protein
MFDFQVAQSELRFAARQQPYTRTLRRESDGEPFADPAPRAGDQDGNSFERLHLIKGNTKG